MAWVEEAPRSGSYCQGSVHCTRCPGPLQAAAVASDVEQWTGRAAKNKHSAAYYMAVVGSRPRFHGQTLKDRAVCFRDR